MRRGLIAIVALVIFCLGAGVVRAELLQCPDCGGPVSSEAVACPTCGHPGPFLRRSAPLLKPRVDPIGRARPVPARIIVYPRPADARVFLDGQELPAGETMEVGDGRYLLTATRDGFLEYREEVMLRAGRSLHIRPRLLRRQDWYAGVKMGSSMMTGIVGVEVQHLHWAVDLGWGGYWTCPVEADDRWDEGLPFPQDPSAGFSAGLRYYGDPRSSAWFLGLAYCRYRDSGDGAVRTFGLLGGYRWRWMNCLDLSLGLGLGRENWEEYAYKDEESGDHMVLAYDFSFGYSF